MRISTFLYCLKQGIVNICRNILFSLASIAMISACIFLFCLFFGIARNVQFMVKNIENTVGISVFFDESYTEDDIASIAVEIKSRSEVREIVYTSAAEAWDMYKKEYFAGVEELAEGFEEDNPLAHCASFQIYLNDISKQDEMVEYLQNLEGIRRVNYSNMVADGLMSFSKIIGILSIIIIAVLLAVAVFLISNTISVAAAFRKSENQIMRLIGATNYMIRAPFVVEGVVLGLIGAVVPLGAMYFLYKNAVVYILKRFSILSDIMVFLPLESIFPSMVIVAMILGVGIGFFGSFFTIRRHLNV